MFLSLWIAIYSIGSSFSFIFATILMAGAAVTGLWVMKCCGVMKVNPVEFVCLRVGWTLHASWTFYLFFLNLHQTLSEFGFIGATTTMWTWVFLIVMAVVACGISFSQNNPLFSLVTVWVMLYMGDFGSSDGFFTFDNFFYIYLAVVALLSIFIGLEKF